jgi:hypothetical protein
MERMKRIWLKITFGVIISLFTLQVSSGLATAAKFDMSIPIDQVFAAVQDPSLDLDQKAFNVKHFGKYFPITKKGRTQRGVASLGKAQEAIPTLLKLLNEDHPKLLYNTIETLAHIVRNYPMETYSQVRPHIEKISNTSYPKVAKKARTALRNMEVAHKMGKPY